MAAMTNAERQKAYRERKKAERAKCAEQDQQAPEEVQKEVCNELMKQAPEEKSVSLYDVYRRSQERLFR